MFDCQARIDCSCSLYSLWSDLSADFFTTVQANLVYHWLHCMDLVKESDSFVQWFSQATTGTPVSPPPMKSTECFWLFFQVRIQPQQLILVCHIWKNWANQPANCNSQSASLFCPENIILGENLKGDEIKVPASLWSQSWESGEAGGLMDCYKTLRLNVLTHLL